MPILVILVAILASIGGQTAASKVRYCLTSALTYKTPQQQNEIFRRCILHKAKVSIKFCFYIQTFWKVFNFPHRILNITALLLFPVCSPTSQKLVNTTVYNILAPVIPKQKEEICCLTLVFTMKIFLKRKNQKWGSTMHFKIWQFCEFLKFFKTFCIFTG